VTGKHRDDIPGKLRWPDRYATIEEFEAAYAKEAPRWASLMERLSDYDGPPQN
jgi:hypothetical protein